MPGWGAELSNADRLEQFKLIYDYIKFHIGLYLATPPVMAIIAESFSVQRSVYFRTGLAAMILIYCVSGVHAGYFMGKYVNDPWDKSFLTRFEAVGFSPNRRFMHHTLYWVGLLASFLGLILAVINE